MNSTPDHQPPQPSPDPSTERWARVSAWIRRGSRSLAIVTGRFLRRAGVQLRLAWASPRAQSARERLQVAAGNARGAATRALPRMRKLLHRSALVGLGCGLVIATLFTVGRVGVRVIPPGKVGVRYSKWSGEGVAARDFPPGIHLSLPGVHKWYEFPASTETLTWKELDGAGDLLNVRASDGTSVRLALTIPYSLVDGEAHQLMAKGLRTSFQEQARGLAEQVLARDLSRLPTEDFSHTESRTALLEESLSRLNRLLEELHLQADGILVESVAFSPAFEKKLAETHRERQRSRVLTARQLEDQEQQTILRRRNEIDRELLDRRIALDLEIEEVRSAGQLEAAERARATGKVESELRADADREYESLVAAGEAALARTRQTEARLRGEILSGPGGSQYLALNAARSTRFREVTLASNDERVPNPLNLAQMLDLFGLGGD